ncbi:uncharacterized protein LOC117329816 [Pecten maximus]|uniref:uncharacterized protein LOC117329816 n=1 Tax=Pecten maximus TaxID=6579 RepID=UPI001458DBD3|nr:uncharacterized protein LOC117329816 [Pecten maximus]
MECIPASLPTSAKFIAVCYAFICIFHLGTCTYSCPDDQKAYKRREYLASVNFPNMYKPNQDCEWRVSSSSSNKKIEIKMIDMDIEYDDTCELDYLEIYDGYDDDSPSFGRFCGTETFSIIGSGIHLYFHFHTDSNINGQGFKFEFKTVSFTTVSSSYPPPIGWDRDEKPKDKEEKDESFGGAKLSTLVGGVLGGLCILVVIIAVCCMCSTRICRQCSLSNNGRQRTSVSPHSSDTETRRRNRTRRHSPPQVSPYIPRRGNTNSQIWSPEQSFPMVPINPPPYRETENQPVYLVQGVPGYNSYSAPSSPPPTYSCGLSSDSNPPAYDDDRNSPPNYVPYDESPPRY